jgi:hypothetical protein
VLAAGVDKGYAQTDLTAHVAEIVAGLTMVGEEDAVCALFTAADVAQVATAESGGVQARDGQPRRLPAGPPLPERARAGGRDRHGGAGAGPGGGARDGHPQRRARRALTCLDERGIAATVVESLAENTVDAVAPAFWALVAGPSGALVHRAVNTMDAMVGHHSPRYEHYG